MTHTQFFMQTFHTTSSVLLKDITRSGKSCAMFMYTPCLSLIKHVCYSILQLLSTGCITSCSLYVCFGVAAASGLSCRLVIAGFVPAFVLAATSIQRTFLWCLPLLVLSMSRAPVAHGLSFGGTMSVAMVSPMLRSTASPRSAPQRQGAWCTEQDH